MDHGRESKNVMKANTNAIHKKCDSFAPLISLVDSDHGSGSQPESEINLEEVEISVQSPDSSGKSSTSSNSSSGDFFHVIPHTLPRSHPSNGIPKPNARIKQSYEKDKVDVSSEALYRLEESIFDSPESTSQFSDITHESLWPQMSPTQSPFLQVMERPGNSEPGRIPASIFSKPASPMEWSVASNESLFSIHIGNRSFRGYPSKMGKDLYRSGELLKSEEPFNLNQINQSGELYDSGELYQSEEPFKSGDPKRAGGLSGSELNSSASKEVQHDDNIDMANNLSQKWNPRAKGAIDAPLNVVSNAHINQGGINFEETKDSVSANRLPDRSEAIVESVTFPKRNPHVPHVILLIVDSSSAPANALAVAVNCQISLANGGRVAVAAPGNRAGQAATGNCVPLSEVVAASFQTFQAAVVGVHHGQAAVVSVHHGQAAAVNASVLIAVACSAAIGNINRKIPVMILPTLWLTRGWRIQSRLRHHPVNLALVFHVIPAHSAVEKVNIYLALSVMRCHLVLFVGLICDALR
ncbi:hypothetical protein F511_16305 [Dorcoceras hygrometricum]|uniref:Uncharacterized protein n=1 Tax=Dorcoceras hygrometricum TaxID=472368 RepID=A0A2Z7B9K5_9LAMI|nr:hypothetical protein F511_16305 [Dorcoceras hygrometricum]